MSSRDEEPDFGAVVTGPPSYPPRHPPAEPAPPIHVGTPTTFPLAPPTNPCHNAPAMNRTRPLLSVATLITLSLPSLAAAATLYSGSNTPSTQGWTNGFIGSVVETPMSPGVQLNTSANNAYYGGYFNQLPAGTLSKTTGFDVSITAALLSESGTNPARSGLSFLILTSDHTGVELAVQPTQIFAQAVGFGSPTGESVAYNTTPLTTYDIAISGTTYALSANGTEILTGPLRDYSATSTPFGPIYSATDLLFIGDDTSSAGGAFQLTSVTVVPEPGSVVLAAVATGAFLRRRR